MDYLVNYKNILKSAFDKLWYQECSNDAFDNGLKSDHFVLSSIANESCNVSIKLPWGKKTKPLNFHNIESQGSINSPLRYSMTIDMLGKNILSNRELSKNLYMF